MNEPSKTDCIIMDIDCDTPLDVETWEKHLKSVERVCGQVKNGLRYKIYRIASQGYKNAREVQTDSQVIKCEEK